MRHIGLALVAMLATSLAHAAEIRGAVVAQDGRAVAAAHIEARIPVTHAELATATTTTDGDFVLAALPDGVVELHVNDTTVLVLTGDTVTIQLTPDEPDLPMSDRPTGDRAIRGFVRLDGKPLANAPVYLSASNRSKRFAVVTNAKGEYRAAGLAALQYRVVAPLRLKPRVRIAVEASDIDLREVNEAEHDIELTSAPAIRGRVMDADGKPVAHTMLRLVHTFPQNEPAHRTDAAGRYSFPAPNAADDDALDVEVMAPRQAPVASEIFFEDGNDKVIDIRLPRFETVHVRIVDPAGKPVPHARITFFGDVGGEVESAVDANGEVTFRLTDGVYEFHADADGFVTKTWTSALRREMDVTLERAVAIRSRAHRGETAIADLRIIAIDPRGERSYATTNADGTFELGGIARGDYRLEAMKSDEDVELSRIVSAPGDVDIDLPLAGKVRVNVRDMRTGKPVAGIMYTIHAVEGEQHLLASVTPIEAGSFEVTLPAGGYRMFISADDYESARAEAHVKVNETTTVDVRLGSGVIVRGRVTGDEAEPLKTPTPRSRA